MGSRKEIPPTLKQEMYALYIEELEALVDNQELLDDIENRIEQLETACNLFSFFFERGYYELLDIETLQLYGASVLVSDHLYRACLRGEWVFYDGENYLTKNNLKHASEYFFQRGEWLLGQCHELLASHLNVLNSGDEMSTVDNGRLLLF
ncbi:hypothetical protein V6R21_30375 [Limibacter armeniacum]|uniref:hypothetical protein n=1 Tax=Limibacter armeniacum TaxID=466084 RepID=UPI002FE5E27C